VYLRRQRGTSFTSFTSFASVRRSAWPTEISELSTAFHERDPVVTPW